ncbi:MAG TPA: dihydroneopterin aldolase [Candidatus Kapabacteria bacterium]|nr:dihydroneopterin aldolase [Candidatus Kapabacteria bacterium]
MWIRLKNIQLYAYHGAHAHEREHGARFEIDVELCAVLERAVKSDDLADTIDYVKIQEAVVSSSTSKRFHLLESLADAIANELLTHFPASEVIVRVRKPGVSAGVVLDTVEVECRKLVPSTEYRVPSKEK